MRIANGVGAALALLTMLGTLASADPLYLGLNHYALPKAGDVVVYVTSGDRFPLDKKMPASQMEAYKALAPDGTLTDLPQSDNGLYATEFKAAQEGTYVFGVAKKPITVNRKVKDEAGNERQSTLAIFRSAKTILTVGKPSDTALKPLGLRIEIVPRVHPASLKVGDYFDFDVLLDGKPFDEHIVVQATHDGFSQETREFAYASQKNPGAPGRVRIMTPGVWRVAIYYTNPLTRGYGAGAGRSYLRASLTFSVGNEADFGD